ncbi:hypothetical protein Aph01nite_80180 [Acrocarpospora phusangensis]|uniref:Cyclodipeptide synthase n=1 Tax=Acrocarpospora phusangensis TaxID=1070424 RepID=A0A919QJ21_9ACTN|nr:tRNA-dependent cyclodipeptide synthase [Acrocarpospora phusangensis]GIH29708.1 hypothetical protein Aph01nite_80180 [Acrocarpospora phusangensis]
MEGGYRVRVARRGGPDWREAEVCHLLISVGQPYHEGAKLVAVVDWVNERFRRCHVTVADTLYRHNLGALTGARPEFAHDVTARRGREWVARNRGILARLAMPVALHRWDEWLAHPGYPAARSAVDGFMAAEPRFAALVDEHVGEVLTRVRARGTPLTPACPAGFREFLVEELACMELFTGVVQGAEAYPGSLGRAMEGCRTLPGAPPGLVSRRVAQLDFRRRRGEGKFQGP